MQFLDSVLDIAAPAVDLLVDEARRLAQIGHDEARVVARLPAGELHDFGLDHHAALTSEPTYGHDCGCRGRSA